MCMASLTSSQEKDLHLPQACRSDARRALPGHRLTALLHRLGRGLSPTPSPPEHHLPEGWMALVFHDGIYRKWLPPGHHKVPLGHERVEIRWVLPDAIDALESTAGTAARQAMAAALPDLRSLRFLDGTLVELVRLPPGIGQSVPAARAKTVDVPSGSTDKKHP